jgi:hypothetical protein
VNYAPFASWDDVLDHVRIGHPTYYHAPLDYRPAFIQAKVKGRKVRVTPLSRECDPFTADEGHLDRFRKGVRAAE